MLRSPPGRGHCPARWKPDLRGQPRTAAVDAVPFTPRSTRSASAETDQDRDLRAQVGIRAGEDLGPFHRFSWNRVEHDDGTVTQFYYFRAGNPGVTNYVELLQRFVPGFSSLQSGQDYWTKPGFLVDPRKDDRGKWHQGSVTGLASGAGASADLLIVTASHQLIDDVDQFLAATLAQIPQIEIEVTILEVAMEDDLRHGMRTAFTRGTESDPESNFLRSGAIELAEGLVEGTFGSFSAIQDETVIEGLVELLESTGSSNVLSAPKLAVLNGHRAVIDAGSKVPVFTPSFNAAGISAIKTAFKPTGIQVVVTPLVLSADMVQLDISVLVSAVTGFVSAGVGSGAEVENPLISKRNAHTVVNVPTGQTVLIGGLTTTDELESVKKVPVLGNIPLLGFLFKSKQKRDRRTQVLFLVKPKRLDPRYRDDVLFDPADPDPVN